MPGNSGNKSNKPKLHGSTNSLRDTFNQALNEATTAEQARSKANSGEGHSAKSSNTNFAELREWYDKLDYDTRSAMDKAADKPTSRFTNEERDNFYLKVDPYHYLQYLQYRYPGKTEFIQSRMHSYYGFRRHLEENGIAPKKPSETKPETQYAEQAAKEQTNKEEVSKNRSIFDIVQDEVKAENSKPASQPTANPEKIVPEKQAAKDMVDNSKPAERNEQPAWVTTPWRETMYRLGDRTPEINPPEKYEPSSNNLWDFPELAVSRNSSRIPNYLKDAYERKVERGIRKQGSRLNLDNPRSDGFGRSPARYNSFSSILGRNEPLIHGLTAAGVLGLGGLGLYGKYALQNNDEELAQTQVPYRMEPESVNKAIVQPEPTPEQQFVLQSTSPFDYAKIANLFDLYARYGSPDSTDNSVNDEELINEVMSEFESPQNPPDVGTNINDANLVIPDADEAPEEINDAMLDAKPGSFWKVTRDVVSPKVNAVKNAAQNVFGRTLARSKTAPKASNGSASNIQDTSNGPVVLNASRQHKTRDVQNNSITSEQAAASQMVNQYAGIPAEVVRAKNQPFLTTDAIWNRLRQKGLSSPEQAIRSGLFTPDEVRYITENDLWRYR